MAPTATFSLCLRLLAAAWIALALVTRAFPTAVLAQPSLPDLPSGPPGGGPGGSGPSLPDLSSPPGAPGGPGGGGGGGGAPSTTPSGPGAASGPFGFGASSQLPIQQAPLFGQPQQLQQRPGGFAQPGGFGQGTVAASPFGGAVGVPYTGLAGSSPYGRYSSPYGMFQVAPQSPSFNAPMGGAGFGAPLGAGFGAPVGAGIGAPLGAGVGAPVGGAGFGAPVGGAGFGAPVGAGFGAPAGAGIGVPAGGGIGSPLGGAFGSPNVLQMTQEAEALFGPGIVQRVQQNGVRGFQLGGSSGAAAAPSPINVPLSTAAGSTTVGYLPANVAAGSPFSPYASPSYMGGAGVGAPPITTGSAAPTPDFGSSYPYAYPPSYTSSYPSPYAYTPSYVGRANPYTAAWSSLANAAMAPGSPLTAPGSPLTAPGSPLGSPLAGAQLVNSAAGLSTMPAFTQTSSGLNDLLVGVGQGMSAVGRNIANGYAPPPPGRAQQAQQPLQTQPLQTQPVPASSTYYGGAPGPAVTTQAATQAEALDASA